MKAKDAALLTALQENCRAGLKDLSRKLHLSVSTVHERIAKLEEQGVIKRYAAIVDAEKVGRPTVAFVLVSLRYRGAEGQRISTQREVAERISKMPMVQEAYVIAGEWDMILKIRARNTRELGEFVFGQLREVPGVEKTATFESFIPIKDFGPVLLDEEEQGLVLMPK